MLSLECYFARPDPTCAHLCAPVRSEHKNWFSLRLSFIATLLVASCASDPTGGVPREIITQVPQINPTMIHFELENLPASAFPKLTAAENALPAQERVKLEKAKYAERIAAERGWCPLGIYPLRAVTVQMGAGRRITRFTVECKQG